MAWYIISVFVLSVFLYGSRYNSHWFLVSMAILVIFALLFDSKYREKEGIAMPDKILLPAIFIFMWSLISLVFNGFLWNGILNLLKQVIYVVFLVILTNTVRNKSRELIVALGILNILQSVAIIVQKIYGLTVSGLFSINPNLAGSFICSITVLYLALAFMDGPLSSNAPDKIYSFFVILSGITALVLLSSRGSLLLFSLCAGFLILNKFKIRGLVLILAMFVLFPLVLNNEVIMHIIKLHDPYSFYRPKIWLSSIRMMIDNPVYGVGSGNFGNFFPKYNFPVYHAVGNYGRFTDFAHSGILQIGAELGVPGLILFLWLIINIFRNIYRNFPVLMALLVIFVQGLFDITWHLPAIIFLAIILFSISGDKEDPGVPGDYSLLCLSRKTYSLLLVSVFFLVCVFSLNLVAETALIRGNLIIPTKINPLNSSYVYGLAISENNIDRKITLLKRCTYIDENNYLYNQELGLGYSSLLPKDMNYLVEAVSQYKAALRKNPYNAPVYFLLGDIYLNMKEYKKSRELFLKAWNIEPNFIKSIFYSGKCSELLGETKRAEKEYYRVVLIKRRLKNIDTVQTNYERFLLE